MAAFFNMDLAELNQGSNLPQACYQAVLGVFRLFAYVGSTNIYELQEGHQRSKRLH